MRRHVLEDRAQLRHHQLGGHALHSLEPRGVLHDEQRDDGFTIRAELMEYLPIGLDSNAARGSEPAMVMGRKHLVCSLAALPTRRRW